MFPKSFWSIFRKQSGKDAGGVIAQTNKALNKRALKKELHRVCAWIETQDATAILAPAWALNTLQDSSRLSRFYSYALPYDGLKEVDVAVLQSGYLHRLDPKIGRALLDDWHLGYASEAFACYTRSPQSSANQNHLEGSHLESWFETTLPAMRRQPETPVNSALIVSACGLGNVGDDLVTLATEHILKEAGVFQVTCSGSFVTQDHMLQHDAIVLGGGGTLYDGDHRNLENYVAPLLTGSRLGKATAALGVGTQGIRTEFGGEAISNALRETGHVSVRSAKDVSILTAIDPALDGHVEHGSDLGFCLADHLGSQVDISEETDGPVIVSLSAISTKPSRGEIAMDEVVSDVLTSLVKDGKAVVLGLQSEDDRAMYERLAKQHPEVELLDLSAMGPIGAASIYAKASAVITSRFHGLIYACIFGRPVVALHRGDCKLHRLVTEDIPSLLPQLVTAKNLTGATILKAFENAQAPDRKDIEACEARAQLMAQSFVNYIQNT